MEELGPRSAAWRLVKILKALAGAPEGIGVRETARSIGVDKSSISRMLGHLQMLEIVTQDPVASRYRVGPALYAIAAGLVARDSLAQAGQPILDELTRRFNENTYLAVRRDLDFQYRAKADCTQAMRYVIDIGYVGPLHAGAAGRAILSGMSDEDLRRTLQLIPLTQITGYTITDPDRLAEEAAKHREMGYVYTAGERTAGGTAYAVPFFDALGRCGGAVVLSQPADRHTEEAHPAIVEALIQAGQQMTARIGGLPGAGFA